MNLPIEKTIFHSYVSLPEGITSTQCIYIYIDVSTNEASYGAPACRKVPG